MTDDRSLERAARSWLETGPTQAPDRAVEAALLRIRTTSQERDLRIPWRTQKMLTPARVAAAAVIGALLVGGTFFVLRPGGSSVGGPGPTPTPVSDAAFLEARNAICLNATRDLGPLKSQFLDLFDGSLTQHQRDAWVAALQQFSDGYDAMITNLATLPAPAAIAAEHSSNVQDFRDMADQIHTLLAKLKARDDAAAGAADAATDPIDARIVAWENRYGFENCP